MKNFDKLSYFYLYSHQRNIVSDFVKSLKEGIVTEYDPKRKNCKLKKINGAIDSTKLLIIALKLSKIITIFNETFGLQHFAFY